MEQIIYQMSIPKPLDDDFTAVEAVKNGDNSAFDLLMHRHQEKIARQMRRFSRDKHTIEELTQTVFINAYKSIDNYQPKAPFLHWLRTIASRVGYNYWTKEAKKISTFSLQEWDQPLEANDLNSQEKPEAAAELLEKILNYLSPKDRQALCMMHLDGMSAKEIAKTMNWTVAMVKMRCYRARLKLRKLLNNKEIGELLNEYR